MDEYHRQRDRCGDRLDPSSVQSEVTLHCIDDSYRLARHGHSFLVEQQPTIWIHTRSQADQVLVEIVDNGIPRSSTSSLNHSSPGGKGKGLDLPVTKSLVVEVTSWLDPVILVSRFGFLVNPKK